MISSRLRDRAAYAGVVGLATALLLVAAPALLAAEQTHVVKIESMVFGPSTITVKRGEKVVWRNNDLVPHTATAGGRFDSGNIAPGKSWTYTADTPGRYDYVCTYHPGMKAVLVVQ